MQGTLLRLRLFSGVAALALIAGGGVSIAQSVNSDEGERLLAAAQVVDDAAAQPQNEAEADDSLYGKFTVPAQGTYRFEAAPGSGVKLRVDGVLVIDTTGPVLDGDVPVTAILSLTAGEHAVQIDAESDDMSALASLTFGALGSERQSILNLSTKISAAEAREIAAKNSAIVPNATAAAPQSTTGGGIPGLSGGTDTAAFSIGGSSSRSKRSLPADPASGGSGGGASGSDGMSSGGMLRLAAAPSNTTTTDSGSTTTNSGGGGVTSVPSFGGGSAGVTQNPAPGIPGAPGTTPTGGSAPTPTPVNPTTTPTPETVQASPLSPPANPELTQAVQLTSAGNVNGQVPNTGATLFGAVQSSSVFDIVNVSVSGSNRNTTVDVGPMTGQFAVRLFPEDFASSNTVQVTVTGASSSSAEVEAEPVTYTVTAMPVQDGVSQALSRLTFGATPELYSRVRAIGFQNFVEEQLNPASINDAAFNAMNPNAIVDTTEENGGRLLENLTHREMAYAAFSEKQLQVIMGRFWANHFHAVEKGSNIYAQNAYDLEFFRENAFTTFRELLVYSARSPLMSRYLDNDLNRFRENRENEGINENYGREILELHTVGVEAGYTTADVDVVSRVFSGWRWERTNPDADDVAHQHAFRFFPEDHDPQDKLIPFLGTTIAGREGEAGVQEGEELIAILANHPSTQARTCRKLVEMLVSDTPPDGFVQACVAAWGTDGDIDAMLRSILLNPAYVNTVDYQRNKAKTPFEYAASAIRAFGARPEDPTDRNFWRPFREAHELAGFNFVRFPVPTGLPEVSNAWLNSASMVAALNRVTDVIENRQNFGIDPVTDITDAGLETAEEVAAFFLAVATADNFTSAEFESVVAVLKGEDGIFEPRVQDEMRALEKALGLIVVSPSFQLQ